MDQWLHKGEYIAPEGLEHQMCVFVCVSWWVVGPHSCGRECCLSHMLDEQTELQHYSRKCPTQDSFTDLIINLNRHTHTYAHKQISNQSSWRLNCYTCLYNTCVQRSCLLGRANLIIPERWFRCLFVISMYRVEGN